MLIDKPQVERKRWPLTGSVVKLSLEDSCFAANQLHQLTHRHTRWLQPPTVAWDWDLDKLILDQVEGKKKLIRILEDKKIW